MEKRNEKHTKTPRSQRRAQTKEAKMKREIIYQVEQDIWDGYRGAPGRVSRYESDYELIYIKLDDPRSVLEQLQNRYLDVTDVTFEDDFNRLIVTLVSDYDSDIHKLVATRISSWVTP